MVYNHWQQVQNKINEWGYEERKEEVRYREASEHIEHLAQPISWYHRRQRTWCCLRRCRHPWIPQVLLGKVAVHEVLVCPVRCVDGCQIFKTLIIATKIRRFNRKIILCSLVVCVYQSCTNMHANLDKTYTRISHRMVFTIMYIKGTPPFYSWSYI